jgi:hypothetical protein
MQRVLARDLERRSREERMAAELADVRAADVL